MNSNSNFSTVLTRFFLSNSRAGIPSNVEKSWMKPGKKMHQTGNNISLVFFQICSFLINVIYFLRLLGNCFCMPSFSFFAFSSHCMVWILSASGDSGWNFSSSSISSYSLSSSSMGISIGGREFWNVMLFAGTWASLSEPRSFPLSHHGWAGPYVPVMGVSCEPNVTILYVILILNVSYHPVGTVPSSISIGTY